MVFARISARLGKKWSRTLAVLAGLSIAYGLVLALSSPAGFPDAMRMDSRLPFLADKPLGEDAYYMFTIAWNLASGKGLVYNYDRITTGIQPLSTFVYAGFAWIVRLCGGDKWIFARVVLLFCLLCGLGIAHQCGRIAGRIAPNPGGTGVPAYVIAFLGTLFHFSLFALIGYGLETAIYLLLISVCVRFTLRLESRPLPRPSQAVLFGGLAGLTALARIDFGLIAAIFLIFALWRRRIRIVWAAIAGAAALAIVSPWFLWVKSASGRWMPSSGTAQAAFISFQDAPERLWNLAKALIGHLTPWAYTGTKIFALLAFLSFGLFLIWLLRSKQAVRAVGASLSKSPFLTGWAIALGSIVVIYILFFWAYHFYPRYTAPALVLLLPLISTAVAARMASLEPAKAAAVLLLLPLCFCFWAARTYHRGTTAFSMTIAAGLVQREYPEPRRVGAFQSGVLGFFNPNVFNLDGKMDPQALLFLRQGAIDAYIDREDIDVLIDWPGYITSNLSEVYLKRGWIRRSAPVLEGLMWCYERQDR